MWGPELVPGKAKRRVVDGGCTAELVEAIASTAGSAEWDVAVE